MSDYSRLLHLAGITPKKIVNEMDGSVIGDIVHDALWDLQQVMKIQIPEDLMQSTIQKAVERYSEEMNQGEEDKKGHLPSPHGDKAMSHGSPHERQSRSAPLGSEDNALASGMMRRS